MERYPERFVEFVYMDHEPQTNEVRRSACLIGGFLTIARESGLPLRCFEVGASAGLNQLWDRFHYRLGDAGATRGNDRSRVDMGYRTGRSAATACQRGSNGDQATRPATGGR